MRSVRTAGDLKGLWAAAPTPFDASGRFDSGAFEHNIERYAEIPMDGVYTTDSDGEFYAVERDEFERVIAAFARAMEPTGMAAAAGVTWCNTAGIVDRMRICRDHGIVCCHVAYPFWMPLSRNDVSRFWDDVARAVPEARWVHYNTPRTGLTMTGRDYARLHEAHPERLIGVKLGTTDALAMAECIGGAPRLSHLAGGDYATLFAAMLGAAGVCSYWANTLPRWTRRLVDHCLAGEWEAARPMQKRLLEWEARHVSIWREAGHLHGIVGKARGALSGWLEGGRFSRAPYYPIDEALFARVKREFDRYWEGEE